jgi:hypothetical protein
LLEHHRAGSDALKVMQISRRSGEGKVILGVHLDRQGADKPQIRAGASKE